MPPRPVDLATAGLGWLRAFGAVGLFASAYFAIFWSPGFLLAAFAAVYAADSRTLSLAHDRSRRRTLVADEVRAWRGGWLDSAAYRPA